MNEKKKFAAGAVAGWIVAWLLDPLITLYRLNVETWASSRGYDQLYEGISENFIRKSIEIVIYVLQITISGILDILLYISGPFGFGFAIASAILAFWEPIMRLANFGRREKIRPIISYSTRSQDLIMLDGGKPADRKLVAIHNRPENVDIIEMSVFLDFVQEVRGDRINVGKRLLARDSMSFYFSVPSGAEKDVIVFDSPRREKPDVPVQTPSLMFGPIDSRKKYLTLPPGRYLLQLSTNGQNCARTHKRFEVILTRTNRILFRVAKGRFAQKYA
jgi:hypothetical protein